MVYQLSEYLGLTVVPKTILIPSSSNNSCEEQNFEDNFPGFKATLTAEWPECRSFILQEQIVQDSDSNPIDINLERAHQVLFFNMIIGRGDSKRTNSLIDQNRNVWEVDNDGIFGEWSKIREHWLKEEYNNCWETRISNELINHILGLKLDNLNVWD